MNRRDLKKLLVIISVVISVIVLLAGMLVLFYLKGLPSIVSNDKFISYVEQMAEKYAKVDLDIQKPVLVTSLSPEVQFSVDKIGLYDKKNTLLNINDFSTKISFADIFDKKVVINKVTLKYLFADVNKILALPILNQEKKEEQKESDWTVDVFQSVMKVDNAVVLYNIDKDTKIRVDAKNLSIDDNVLKKYVTYDVLVNIAKGKEALQILTSDGGNVYIENKNKLVINDSNIKVNKSNILLNGYVDANAHYNIDVTAKKFSIPEVLYLLDTQLVPNNIAEQLVYFKNIDGNFDFQFNLSNEDMKGKINLNKLSFNLVPFSNLPILLNSGDITVDTKTVNLKNFKGYYDNKSYNKMNFEGVVNDYMKSVDTNLTGGAVVTNDFAKKYLTKMLSYPIEIKGKADTKVVLKSKYNKIDLKWIYIFKQGNGFIIDGDEDSLTEHTGRAITADMHFEDMLLNIRSISYYVGTPKMDRDYVRIPIVSMKGNIDLSDGKTFVKDFGLELPKPMPSGFLNLLVKQKLFKKGKFTGKVHLVNTGKYPVLVADMKAENVAIPSQRLFIKNGQFKTDKNNIHIIADGRYRRSGYEFDGTILNEIKFPIIVKDVNLTVDNVDVERYLRVFNNQKPSEQAATDVQTVLAQSAAVGGDEDDDDDVQTFDLANLIIEKCVLKAKKGFYKDIKFSDVAALLTLDKNSLLKITSNRFDIAEGISSAKIDCDLKNHNYSIVLGVKDVNSDIMATSLLNLPNEINGKASGILSLNTDDSLKLNGKMVFLIKNGVIGKVGLIEYVMKAAALFRNPLTMISPSAISDLVNIPEGRFDKIDGEIILKDNNVQKMMIKSYAPELSAFIIGRYDLENKDASLRIYTKFANRGRGALGFLRNISLNSLANRIPLSSRNDSNYYASEISQLPPIDADEKDCQIFLTKVDGDVERNNFISSLKKIK